MPSSPDKGALSASEVAATLTPMSPTRYARRARVRRRQRALGATLIILALGVTVVGVGQHSSSRRVSPNTSPSATSTSTLASTSAVGIISLRLVEPATATHAARSLETNVRYPATGVASGRDVVGAAPLRDQGPHPLVVFSQGFDIQPEAYALLLDAWASAGYVVADPVYPFTSPQAAGGLVRADIVHHPADLSFVITSLLDDSARPGSVLSGLVQKTAVGVVGQSDGGDVTLAAAASTCCRDGRIKAAIVLSGAELSWFPGKYFSTPALPLLVVQGSRDFVMNPAACSVELYDQARQPKYYLSMLGQNHLSAYVPPGPALQEVERVTIDFLGAYLRHDVSQRNVLRAAGNVRGLATLSNAASVGPNRGYCPDAPVP